MIASSHVCAERLLPRSGDPCEEIFDEVVGELRGTGPLKRAPDLVASSVDRGVVDHAVV
jgi:hypothetical protein